jgi:hypothetical protein
VERVLSDNAKPYHSGLWRETCSELQIGRRYTRPYSPWTNGKAEAQSRRSCASGLTASSTRPACTAAAHYRASSAGTTGDDHTAHSAARHRSAASQTSVVSTARRRGRARGRPTPPGPRRTSARRPRRR